MVMAMLALTDRKNPFVPESSTEPIEQSLIGLANHPVFWRKIDGISDAALILDALFQNIVPYYRTVALELTRMAVARKADAIRLIDEVFNKDMIVSLGKPTQWAVYNDYRAVLLDSTLAPLICVPFDSALETLGKRVNLMRSIADVPVTFCPCDMPFEGLKETVALPKRRDVKTIGLVVRLPGPTSLGQVLWEEVRYLETALASVSMGVVLIDESDSNCSFDFKICLGLNNQNFAMFYEKDKTSTAVAKALQEKMRWETGVLEASSKKTLTNSCQLLWNAPLTDEKLLQYEAATLAVTIAEALASSLG